MEWNHRYPTKAINSCARIDTTVCNAERESVLFLYRMVFFLVCFLWYLTFFFSVRRRIHLVNLFLCRKIIYILRREVKICCTCYSFIGNRERMIWYVNLFFRQRLQSMQKIQRLTESRRYVMYPPCITNFLIVGMLHIMVFALAYSFVCTIFIDWTAIYLRPVQQNSCSRRKNETVSLFEHRCCRSMWERKKDKLMTF